MKKIKMTKVFNPLIKLLQKVNVVNKLFGNLVYDAKVGTLDLKYHELEFSETIKKY